MASIKAVTSDRVFSVQKWLGLNEHPDGDTRLKLGEAAEMVNWRITRDGNLKLRPGQEFVTAFGTAADWEAVTSRILTRAGLFQSGDVLMIGDNLLVTPGKLVMEATGGTGASLIEGRVRTTGVTLTGGTLHAPGDAWTVQEGTLVSTGTAGMPYTIAELRAALEELGEGESLYFQSYGVTFALKAGAVVETEEGFELYGRIVTAEPRAGTSAPVAAMWAGVLGGKDVFLAACNDMIYSLYDADSGVFSASALAGETVRTDKGVSFFQFDGIVYILNGYEYYKYDGVEVIRVEGYRPLVAITIGPQGTGEAGELTGEFVNRLNGNRRVWISPDGTGTVFQLPEKNLAAVDYVKDLASGEDLPGAGYTADLTAGTVTFSTAPARAVNSIEIGYSVSETYRSQVTGMLFSEFYSGTTDTRIFLYGDGTNKTIYSGMDYDGLPRADYFPDQYEVLVGDANTPITSMIRHYGSLIAYKPTEVCGTELYQWTNSSYYTSNLTRDERQARRISDRIQKSIKEFDFKTVHLWDDNDSQEFYLLGDNKALVWNYAADAWYRYEDLDASCICSFHGDLYLGSNDGRIRRFSDSIVGDEGRAIYATWKSGAIDFGAAYSRKYSAALWLGLKPIEGTSVNVTVETDRKNTFLEKVVSSEKAKVAGQPFMVKTKLKAKKFVFYRLILNVREKMLPVTVTNAEIRVRMTSDAK